jgi:hypothetical protein
VQLAPSTYYANKARTPSARDCRDAVIGPALQTLWEDNYRVYGVTPIDGKVAMTTCWRIFAGGCAPRQAQTSHRERVH